MTNILSEAAVMQTDWTASPKIIQETRKHFAAMARHKLAIRRQWRQGLRIVRFDVMAMPGDAERFRKRVASLTVDVMSLIAMAPVKGMSR